MWVYNVTVQSGFNAPFGEARDYQFMTDGIKQNFL